MTRDEQEALSRKYGNELVLLLPLSSGNVAVFNTARELCSIVEPNLGYRTPTIGDLSDPACGFWFPPKRQEALMRACADDVVDTLRQAGLI
jgi:hypothetical protein